MEVGNGTPVCATGSDPSIAPNLQRLVYVNGSTVTTAAYPGCATIASFGTGSDPAWSPDGLQIVFIKGNDITVANAAGGGEQSYASTGIESDPAWSPDGSKIAYASDGNVFVMNADGAGRTQLTTTGGGSPTWSPSGDEVAYVVGGSLKAVPSGGGSPREILPSSAAASSPDWGLAVANIAAPGVVRQDGGDATTADVFDGDVLSAGTGGWTSISAVTGFSYQWKRLQLVGRRPA